MFTKEPIFVHKISDFPHGEGIRRGDPSGPDFFALFETRTPPGVI